MSRKCWTKLAGFIVINSALAADYQAGFASAHRAKAIALVDRHGTRVVIAEAGFPVTQAIENVVAARVLKAYNIERGAILLHGTGGAPGTADDLVSVISAAFANAQPASVEFDGSEVSIRDKDGRCRATFFPIAADGCREGTAVRPPVRSAFRMIDLDHGLLQRGDVPPSVPVQGIAFGKQFLIVAAGDEVSVSTYPPRGQVASSADPGVQAALAQVLRRITH